jgi:methionyl-tRNA formyltransferase
MRTLENVVLFAAESGRSRAYLDLMLAAGIRPASALFVEIEAPTHAPAQFFHTDLFDNETPLPHALERADISFTRLRVERLTDPAVTETLGRFREELVVFSGPAGGILRKPFFALRKRFLHVHPGRLPDYRGSTPMYYSLLREGALTASAIFLEAELDSGGLILEREYAPPTDRRRIDLEFDPWMRADTMVAVLEDYATRGVLRGRTQPRDRGETFYIIHPLLKHLALLGPRFPIEDPQ